MQEQQELKSILLVCGSSARRRELRELFEGEFNVLLADSLSQSLALLQEHYREVFCVLVCLGKAEAFELLSSFSSNINYVYLPTVVYSSGASRSDELEALSLGAADFISCDDSEIIFARVKNIVSKRELTILNKFSNAMLRSSEDQRQIKRLLDEVPGGIACFAFGDDISVPFANNGFYLMLGYSRQEYEPLFMRSFSDRIIVSDLEAFKNAAALSLADDRPFSMPIKVKKHPNGILWLLIRGRRVISHHDGSAQLLCFISDITKEKLIELELQYKAEYDALTGARNQDNFYKTAKALMNENPSRVFMVGCVDIERFKVINDLFGSDEGDRLLCHLAKTLAHGLGTNLGCFGRLVADVFVLCIPYSPGKIDRVVSDMVTALKHYPLSFPINAAFGFYIVEDPSLPVSLMCDRARLALGTVKGNYISNYAVYDEKLRDTLLREQQILGEMDDALLGGQFVFYLQPVFNLAKGQPESAEALVRWQHPTRGLLAPGEFIPLFERSRFITKLDFYIWEHVCGYLRRRLDEGLPVIPISVNVSRLSLFDLSLCEKIVKLVDKYSLSSSLLKFEITETAYTDDPEQLLSTVKSLQQAGFSVLMDDFGSGYSSLNTLKDLPVDVLKIDMRFLGGFEFSERAGAILTSVVRMAKQLELPVIAEGVETAEQADFLGSIGCECIQGYYFSRPLPVDEFEALTGNTY